MQQPPQPPPATDDSPRQRACPARATRRVRSTRGAWTILAIFAVGGLVLAGLWLSPRAQSPSAPLEVPPGVPETALCVVTCDLRGRPHTIDSVLEAFRSVTAAPVTPARSGRPDYVLLVGVEADEITDLAAGLGMQGSYDPRLFQRAGKVRGGHPVGVALLSRHPLYEGARIGTGRGPTAGVAAVSVVDNHRFRLACVDLDTDGSHENAAVLVAWVKGAAGTPVLVGGIPGAGAERVGSAGGLTDLAPARPLLASPQWRSTASGTADAGRGGKWSWVVVQPAGRAPASTGTTRASQPAEDGR